MPDPARQATLPPERPRRPNYRPAWIAFWGVVIAALVSAVGLVIAAYINTAGSHTAAGPARSTAPATGPVSPPPVSNGGSCRFGSVCLAADGTLSGGAKREKYVNDPD